MNFSDQLQDLKNDVEDDVKESIKAVEQTVDAVSDRIDGAVSDRIQSVEQAVSLNSDRIADISSVGGVTLGEANEIVVPAAGGVVTIQGQFKNGVKVTSTMDGSTSVRAAVVSTYGDSLKVAIPQTNPKASKCQTASATGVGEMVLKIYKTADATAFETRVIKIDSNSGEFGDGRDGDMAITTTVNWNDAKSKAYALAANKLLALNGNNKVNNFMKLEAKTSVTGLACGDRIVVLNMGSYSTADTATGAVQHAIVQSVSGAIVTLQSPGISADIMSFTYSTANMKIVMQRVPQYKKLTISGNGEIVARSSNYNAYTGVVAFVAHTININTKKGAAIKASNVGYEGGTRGGNSANDAYRAKITGGFRGANANRYSGYNDMGAWGGAGCGSGLGGAGGATNNLANWGTGGANGIVGHDNRRTDYLYSTGGGNFAGTNNMPGGGGGGGSDYQYGGAGGGGAHCAGTTYSTSSDRLTLGGGAANGAGGGASDTNAKGGEPNGNGGKRFSNNLKDGGHGGSGGRGGGIALVNVKAVEECCGSPGTLFIEAGGGGGGGGGGGSGGTHKDGGGGGGQGGGGAAGGSVVVRIGSGHGKLNLGHIDVSGGNGGGGGGGAGVPNQHNPSASGGGGAGAGIGGGGGGGTTGSSWGCAGGEGANGLTGAAAKSGETARGCRSHGAANGGGGGTYRNGGKGGAANKGGYGSSTSCNKGVDAPGMNGGNGGAAENQCGGDGNRGAGGGGGGAADSGTPGLKLIH